ncbi:MAG: hypothetical protein PSN44_04595 [Gammaproteobacteria bacterium]|nr:hypothetical protein [Gammaproteobacteria bacterium]
MKVFSFRNFRVIILLALLASAAIYTKEQRLNTTSWHQPIEVAIYPINGDASPDTDNYIENLNIKHFSDIEDFFIRSSKQYQLIVENPITLSLGNRIDSHPPQPPVDRSDMLKVALWSMKLRYWTYKNTPDDISNKNRIRLYILYHQGSNGQALEHSLGLQKGLIGIIHAYAKPDQNKQNSIVMAHEILHTVGASDKYNFQDNQPLYPNGYAKPEQSPLFPQRYAEIMAGRIPINETQAKMPKDLRFCLVGEQTAKEINWIASP